MLQVYTARLTYHGSDRLDISKKGRDPVGSIFAPSTSLVEKVQKAFRQGGSFDSWRTYDREYQIEMGSSYLTHRAVWDELLSQDSVTLVCYCQDPDKCHRSVLARILAGYGATDMGERAEEVEEPVAAEDPSEAEAYEIMLTLPEE